MNPRVVFAIPGNKFSSKFLISWSSLLSYAIHQGHYLDLSNKTGHLPNVQNMCLGGDVLRGRNQKPFDGRLDYTHVMMIDSDMVFRPSHYQALLSADEPVVSAVYKLQYNDAFVCGKDDEEYFRQNAHLHWYNQEEIDSLPTSQKGLAEVDWTGNGFMLVKREALESLKYPWFYYSVDGEDIVDTTMPDINFCYDLRKAGFKIHIHPKIIVGHEKSTVLY